MKLNEINKLSSSVRLALTMGAVATAGIATTAQAQNADTGDKKSQNLETIVVTGSNIRRVDMDASPYDATAWGSEPIMVETPDGRADYARRQREFAERGAPIRVALLAIAEDSAD